MAVASNVSKRSRPTTISDNTDPETSLSSEGLEGDCRRLSPDTGVSECPTQGCAGSDEWSKASICTRCCSARAFKREFSAKRSARTRRPLSRVGVGGRPIRPHSKISLRRHCVELDASPPSFKDVSCSKSSESAMPPRVNPWRSLHPDTLRVDSLVRPVVEKPSTDIVAGLHIWSSLSTAARFAGLLQGSAECVCSDGDDSSVAHASVRPPSSTRRSRALLTKLKLGAPLALLGSVFSATVRRI
mmetsp:Transcript_2669/g.7987  ORF Transcript_2669/g.7987 Transcript_2669/m.7987 type:complete len:244 (+) Transcript_2669:959-1690(+)